MNVSSTYYSNNYELDSYYYGDNYNYTEQYLLEFGLNQQTSTITGIGYCLFAGVTLMLYTRLLMVKEILINYAKSYGFRHDVHALNSNLNTLFCIVQ
jgi:hypothetical protein